MRFLSHHRLSRVTRWNQTNLYRTTKPLQTWRQNPPHLSLDQGGDQNRSPFPPVFTARFAVAWIVSLHLGEYRGGRFSAQSLGLLYQFFHRISLLLTEPRKKCWPAMGGGEDGGSCNLLQVLFGRGIFFHKQRFRSGSNSGSISSKFSHLWS